jgi:hypothetical protein
MHHKVLVEAWALPFLEGSRCHADVDQHTHKACKEENKLVELIQLNGAWMEGGTSTTPCLCMFFCRVFSFFFLFFLSFCQVLADSLEVSSILAMSLALLSFLPSPIYGFPVQVHEWSSPACLLSLVLGGCCSGSCKHNVRRATFLCDNQVGIIVLVWDRVRFHFASCTV